jgi:hypothetical protein
MTRRANITYLVKTKANTPLLGTLAFGLVLTGNAQQQPAMMSAAAPPAKAPPSAGLLNDWLRSQSEDFTPWDLGGQVRARYEFKNHYAIPGVSPTIVDFGADPSEKNSYLLMREKIHLGYTPTDWMNVFVEGRNSASYWDKRSPDPESDVFDLHQAFLKLGDPKAFPLSLKVGRQEMAYGDERLIGASDWGNVPRVFDAAKLRFENPDVWVDAFVGRVIIPDDHNFNVANDYDIFSGIYASTRTLVPWQETQLYFLARNVSDQSPTAIGENLPSFMRGASPRDIYTIGARVKSLPGKLSGWDYDAELAGQFGDFKFAPASRELDQRAFAAHAAGGYTWAKAFGTPRLGLEYNFSTGDGDPGDGTHGTFDNLFPTNHKSYGYMDFFSWQNMHHVRLSSSIKPAKNLTVTADFHAMWLADTSDYFYQVNGAPRTTGGYGLHPDAGSFVGTELDIVGSYSVTTYANAQVGYGHFFTGDYVKDTLAPVGGAADANWVYVQLILNF